jgi:putative nucleotidyltransferase with HDIG domain
MSAQILVVDDNAAVRDVLVTWLESAGYRCAEACDAHAALAYVTAHHVDVALLDLALPDRDGLWLAQQIRQHTDDLALIVATGVQQFEAAVEGMRLGVLDYLFKPFSRRELLQAVRRAVEWQESLRRDRQQGQALQLEIGVRREALASAIAGLNKATTGAIQALLETLHQRDPDAAAHAHRVARMAVDLAAALDVEPCEMADIERGALLHDIGKVGLPDALVRKEGTHSDEDLALIRTHVELGRDILTRVPALASVATIVASSHEAFDGTGYPDGLSGVDIPRGARIIAIVDTFDALTWDHDATAPLTYARAAAELVRGAGGLFDPAMVHAWLRVADPAQHDDETVSESTRQGWNSGAAE